MTEEIKKTNQSDDFSDKIAQLQNSVSENENVLRDLKNDLVIIKRHMRIRMIMGFLWVFMIFLPIILAYLYLPSFVEQYLNPVLEIYNKF